MKTHTHTQHDLVCSKSGFKSCKNSANSASILWLAVCVCDVMNRPSICGVSVKCQTFSALFHW